MKQMGYKMYKTKYMKQNNFKYYIKEGNVVYSKPFWDKNKIGEYDMFLNISAFRD